MSKLAAAMVQETSGNQSSKISELAESVAVNTAVVNEYLHQHNLPFPSFHEDGPVDLMLGLEAEKARITALEACLHLHDLLCGPLELLRPTVNATVEAMRHFKSQEPTETGFCLAHNTNKSVFDCLEDNPAKAKRFAGAMTSFASIRGHGAEFLVQGYPWASLGHATVVDVGGSEGEYSAALARAFPKLEFIVQDLPAVVQAVHEKRRSIDVADRIKFMEHDMFSEQVVSADIYLFRWIFHNWPDKYVIKILSQLIPAMKAGARVLISEMILPEPNTLPLLRERRPRYAAHAAITIAVQMLT
ncbi:MAG: hypothetical protein Q9201_006592 [Fulgogasparrea decipioides]